MWIALLNIIKKSKTTLKKSIAYEITEKGIKITDRYGDIRRNTLVKMLENNNKNHDWNKIYESLIEFRAMYDEASRLAAIAITKEREIEWKNYTHPSLNWKEIKVII